MKIKFTSVALLLGAIGLAACTSQTPSTTTANINVATTNPTPAPTLSGGVTSAHGGSSTTNAPAASSAPSSGSDSGLDTSGVDAKIAKAEAKAKQANASSADKSVAAAAYAERGNIFYNAGVPTYYKFALRDFRIALKYQPDNADAKEKRDMIVSIYNSMGRPVPDLGNE
ncbi:MAG: hypothetical protein NVSMB56_17740 [Pyrinomonadaceae bacterium]